LNSAWTTRVYFVPQSKWHVSRSLRASEPVDSRERGGNDGGVSEPIVRVFIVARLEFMTKRWGVQRASSQKRLLGGLFDLTLGKVLPGAS